jgi:N-methylhydantoinase B
MPDRVNAEEYGRCCPAHIKFRDSDGSYRILADTEGGGWGGKPFEDGENALLFGEIRVIPIEIMEMRYPVKLRQYRLRANSGGPGRFRGGLGVVKQYECLADCELNAGFDRQFCPPAGVLGGHGSVANRVVIMGLDGSRTPLPSKITDYPVRKGEIISFETAGGGGYGDPATRELEYIAGDIDAGYITSREHLEGHYAVALEPDALAIDVVATERLRASVHEAPSASS